MRYKPLVIPTLASKLQQYCLENDKQTV